MPATENKRGCRLVRMFVCAAVCMMAGVPPVFAGDAPQWMHALVNAPLPTHDEKTDAVLLYSETSVHVIATDKIRTNVREAYKILRPDGRDRGDVLVFLNSQRRVTSLHGWCIPAQGKDYEVKDKEAVEISPPAIPGAELIDDVKAKVLRIPASLPGNIVGYEYEVEETPLLLQDRWDFQGLDPVRESQYSITVPRGWEYKVSWLNYPEAKPVQTGEGYARWVVNDVKGIRKEEDMPPFRGLMGQMIISFFPSGGPAANGAVDWKQMGKWYSDLTNGRMDASAEIKQKANALTSSLSSPVAKMKALAQFMQRDIRYVAIELGIGGWQPHPAAEIFTHRYGDCKDKATLLGSMLRQIGVDSYYVIINTERGSVTPTTPANNGFDHAILAIRLPEKVSDPSLVATMQHPKLGTLLFFDPTNDYIPFGEIGGYLQANYGLLVTPDGGELVELPAEPPALNSIQRVAKLTLDITGKLQGDVTETRVGDRAWGQRETLRTVTKNSERIKPIESVLAASLSNFQIVKASVLNLEQNDKPFGYQYSFVVQNYAQNAGDLLLVRPRVLGRNSKGFLETKEPRQFPIEFDGPARDVDSFEITLPPGYVVDDLPPPVDVDFGFASYHARSEVKGNVLGYTRTVEIKELSVPVNRADELKKFYRIIANDERSTAVLKPAK